MSRMCLRWSLCPHCTRTRIPPCTVLSNHRQKQYCRLRKIRECSLLPPTLAHHHIPHFLLAMCTPMSRRTTSSTCSLFPRRMTRCIRLHPACYRHRTPLLPQQVRLHMYLSSSLLLLPCKRTHIQHCTFPSTRHPSPCSHHRKSHCLKQSRLHRPQCKILNAIHRSSCIQCHKNNLKQQSSQPARLSAPGTPCMCPRP